MTILEIIGGFLAFLLLCWVCSGSKKNPDPRDLKIAANSDGLYYIQDRETGEVLGTYPDEDAAKEHLKDFE